MRAALSAFPLAREKKEPADDLGTWTMMRSH